MKHAHYARALMLVALLVGGLFGATQASAHERREVGKYEFIVGFLSEPAFEGELNALSVRITNAETKRPVENLEKTLKAQLVFGAEQRDMELTPVFRDPGHYKAHFYPTKSGAYTFGFFGDLEGAQIDEKFTSKPGGFNEVQAPAALQFPAKVPLNAELGSQLTEAQTGLRTATLLGSGGLLLGLISLTVAFMALRGRRASAVVSDPSIARSSR
ncbi:MAG TPA: hypothetical protein VFZ66_23910 [Herpetosiphonaceae bacterium]